MATKIETVTIINNAGKIISTGRQLIDLLKEGHAVYKEKKASLQAERASKSLRALPAANDESKSRRSRRPSKSKTSSQHHHHPRLQASRGDPTPAAASSGSAALALTERNLRALSASSKAVSPIPAPHPATTAALNAIDPNMAYGDMPPNLAHRHDLDPAWRVHGKERRAAALASRVEALLDEAHVLHHTATSIIARLKAKPEAAAAVALALAELSSLVAKLSPAALSSLEGAAPAAFSLLASPQFLVGAGVAVGVTVVMFGGWKIIKHIRDSRRDALAWGSNAAAAPVEMSDGVDEALVLDKELAGIESWRRGISPDFGDGTTLCNSTSSPAPPRRHRPHDDGSVDEELISPEADRAIRRDRSRHHRHHHSRGPPDSARRTSRRSTISTPTSHHHHRSEKPEIHVITEEHDAAADSDRDDAAAPRSSKDRALVAIRPRKRDLVLRAVLFRKGKRDRDSSQSAK